MIYCATNHSTAERGVISICLVTSVFILMTLDGVTSFSRITKYMETPLLQSKFFHVMAEILKHLNDTLDFS